MDARRKARRALGRLGCSVGAIRERAHQRQRGVHPDRLRDQPRPLAHGERTAESLLGAGEVAAIAQCHREPNQGAERDLRPAHPLGELVGDGEQLRRGFEVSIAPAQQPPERVREAQLADQPLAFGELGARVARPCDLLPIAAIERQLGKRGLQLDLRRHIADALGQRERLLVAGAGALVVALGVLQAVA